MSQTEMVMMTMPIYNFYSTHFNFIDHHKCNRRADRQTNRERKFVMQYLKMVVHDAPRLSECRADAEKGINVQFCLSA